MLVELTLFEEEYPNQKVFVNFDNVMSFTTVSDEKESVTVIVTVAGTHIAVKETAKEIKGMLPSGF